MCYDYPEEEFYLESEYENEIEALKEAVRSSVKSEILEEMNRLKAENEKLQDIKEHLEEIKLAYTRKMDECDRIAFNAEHNAAEKRLNELLKDHKIIKWKISYTYVHGPKCEKCKGDRTIDIRLPSGRMVVDNCKCQTAAKKFYYPKEYTLVSIKDADGKNKISAYYMEKREADDINFQLYAMEILDNYSPAMKKELIKDRGHGVMKVFFDDRKECQKICDELNSNLGNFMYKNDGTDVREFLKLNKGE